MEYKIGLIKNTHGLKGEVVVKETTDFDRFIVGKTIYFYENNKKVYLKIKSVYSTKKGLIIGFYDYENINLIANFKGKELFTDEKPILAVDEYHEKDIIGKDVYNEKGEYIGVVNSVMDVLQGYILRIGVSGKEALVPFNDYFIIDVLADKIIINEIEGLI